MTDHPPDLLESAHLAYLRGQKQETRYLLEQLLSLQPDNADAIALRDKVEMDMVEEAAVENDRRDQEIGAQIPGLGVVALGILSIAALVGGIWWTGNLVAEGLRIGFNTQVLMHLSGALPNHYPFHVALIRPIVLIAVGGVGLRVVYLNLRAFLRTG
jgi:hypothetical protein